MQECARDPAWPEDTRKPSYKIVLPKMLRSHGTATELVAKSWTSGWCYSLTSAEAGTILPAPDAMTYAFSLPVQTHSVMTDSSGGAGGREGRQRSPRKRGDLLGTQSAAVSNRSPINEVLKHHPSTQWWRECGAGTSSRLGTPKSPKAYLAGSGSLLDIARRAAGHSAA